MKYITKINNREFILEIVRGSYRVWNSDTWFACCDFQEAHEIYKDEIKNYVDSLEEEIE